MEDWGKKLNGNHEDDLCVSREHAGFVKEVLGGEQRKKPWEVEAGER